MPAATLEAATGAWTGAAATLEAATGPGGAAADAPTADAPAATLEAATVAWTGTAAADAPTMGISFFSIAGGFLRGFFFGCGEDDGRGEAVAVRMRECAEGEKEGLYKDEGGVYRNTRSLCTAAACTAT
ncbi:hypothetical protein QYE76_064895 [Lolium multiflorum]|uniref:Uncharacterized protein n=1 Tax=Lolium multiflorum TaxID=4521 RepID=A0AAD8W9I7_LOLMU|nr:hypothetical protein QYE76_064895 [Lolium multiflorum]